jgi:hypothetical protein
LGLNPSLSHRLRDLQIHLETTKPNYENKRSGYDSTISSCFFHPCVAATLAWSATASAGHKYYVSPTGDDTADGRSKKEAWRTLDRVAMQTFAAKDRLLLQGGGVFQGSIQLSPDNSAGDIEIGTYDHGRAVIDAGNGPGIVISNLSGVKITGLEIRGSGQQSNTADGILIVSGVDPIPPNTIHYSDFVIHDIEVHDFKHFGILIHSHWGTGLNDASVTHVVSHDNGLEGITVLADEFPGTPNEDIYIGNCLAYHNHGTRGLPSHSGSGIVLGGVNRGAIEYCEAYENGDQSDAFQTGGPVAIWAWNSQSVTIQFCKAHRQSTANNADGGGYDLDGATFNSVIQYNVSWDNYGYGSQLYDFFWGPHLNNVVQYNVSIGDGRGQRPGVGALNAFGDLNNETFHHNIVYVVNEGDSDVRFLQINDWFGDGLAYHDNLYLAGTSISPFAAANAAGTNLSMFHNLYFFAEEPLPFTWNNTTYNTIDEWRAATGLDTSSLFLGPFPSRVQMARYRLEALKHVPVLRPEMFHALYDLIR